MRGLVSAPVCSLVGGSDSGRPQRSMLIASVGLLEYIAPLGSSIFPPNSSTGLPELCVMFGCGSLHLIQPAAGWNFSEDSYAPICKNNGVALTVSGSGACPRDGSQAGPDTGWSFQCPVLK